MNEKQLNSNIVDPRLHHTFPSGKKSFYKLLQHFHEVLCESSQFVTFLTLINCNFNVHPFTKLYVCKQLEQQENVHVENLLREIL